MPNGTGILWWSERGHPNAVFLIVEDGRVVDCTPYAKQWAMGRTSAEILYRARREGAEVRWMPLSAPPRRFQPHLEPTTRLRRWAGQFAQGQMAHVTLGVIGDRWYVDVTREKWAWAYARRDEAQTDLQRRMAEGEWTWAPANSDTMGRPLPDPALPEEEPH